MPHVMYALVKCLDIQWHLSLAYHPQTDRKTERLNQTLEIYLYCYINQFPHLWVE